MARMIDAAAAAARDHGHVDPVDNPLAFNPLTA
jgi:hypothetical protein